MLLALRALRRRRFLAAPGFRTTALDVLAASLVAALGLLAIRPGLVATPARLVRLGPDPLASAGGLTWARVRTGTPFVALA